MSLRHAILVLLEKEPGSGYDLVQRFKSGIGHFWNATHQQVYQELRKLSDDGLVAFEVEAQVERPDKKVYRITRGGRRALKDWFAEPVKPPRVNDALLVKVFAAHLGEPRAMRAELDRHIEIHRKRLDEYRQMEQRYFEQDQKTRREYRLPYLTLRRGLRYERGTLEWLEEARELLDTDGLPAKPVP